MIVWLSSVVDNLLLVFEVYIEECVHKLGVLGNNGGRISTSFIRSPSQSLTGSSA